MNITELHEKIHEEEKKYPPSDQRLNKLNYVTSLIAVGLLACYFLLCGCADAAGVDIPYFVFTLIVAPIEIILHVAGIYMSILQLVRHRYPRVKLCFTLQALTLTVCIVYVAVVASYHGWAALLG